MLRFRRWLASLLFQESAAAKRIADLEAQLYRKTLESELLGLVNEDLRRWLLANTACAAAVARACGIKVGGEEEPKGKHGVNGRLSTL